MVEPDLTLRLAQYAPVAMRADLSPLAEEERGMLATLVEAARLMNPVFLRQVWTGNPELLRRIAAREGREAEAARAFFAINFGPWDRLAGGEPFLVDRPRPAGSGFYPEDMAREELEGWLAAHPGDRPAFTSTTTVIRRLGQDLVAVPYSREYAAWLEPAARLLRQAASQAPAGPGAIGGGTGGGYASLRRFLELRADALASDDYYPSDLAWMDVDSPIELTLGPYETYQDGLFGYKAAFEAFVTMALPAESRALDRYKELLPWLERNLPVADAWKNLGRGTESPIRVADVVYSAGDTRAGIQTLAFNLPNDERVREAKGSKKVLLRNPMRAKYDRILVPIAQRVLAPEQAAGVSFGAYLEEVLHHELSHGLGPGSITVGGRRTEVRLELKELYSTIEEAKADVMGIYNILALIGRGEMPGSLRRALEPTYVAGLVRAARFGLDEAHGQGVAAQFNYLARQGALLTDPAGRLRTDPAKFPGAIRGLLGEILALQATGDYSGARRFLATYGVASDNLRHAIARLDGVPVDIRPIYDFPEGEPFD